MPLTLTSAKIVGGALPLFGLPQETGFLSRALLPDRNSQMKWNSPFNLLGITAVLACGLSACSESKVAPGDPIKSQAELQAASPAKMGTGAGSVGQAVATAAGSGLADGPDICFRAIANHLGRDVKVSEITSFFSAGAEIDGDATKPAGQMTLCTVEYQNPDDPRKLLSTQLDLRGGAFSEPRPVEITVMGGNAASFNIEDYLVPLSKIDAAALTSVMEAQEAKLSSVYSRYAWTGVRLTAPGALSDKHMLRLDLQGRLAANDIKEDGYASVTSDGKAITFNRLMP